MTSFFQEKAHNFIQFAHIHLKHTKLYNNKKIRLTKRKSMKPYAQTENTQNKERGETFQLVHHALCFYH